MTTEDKVFYKADEGCFIVRKSDGFIMGEAICLGDSDNIDNYEDQEYKEETYIEFYENLGLHVPEK